MHSTCHFEMHGKQNMWMDADRLPASQSSCHRNGYTSLRGTGGTSKQHVHCCLMIAEC